MRVGVLSERGERERRVAVTPDGARRLGDAGHDVVVESGAGDSAGFSDDEYVGVGASVATRADVLGVAGTVVSIDGPDATALSRPEWSGLGSEHLFVALHDPLDEPDRVTKLAATGATTVSLELIPRTTRAQSMDVLSSMATVAGYEAVLLGASRISKMVPMLMTAAGTVPPARFLVLGAGVAGLQAIATARRLGAVVEAYDIRPAAQEEIRSLGARAVELELDMAETEGPGGYAVEQTDEQSRRQLELLAPYVAAADVVITTAAVPGATSPELVTPLMVEAMRPGSVVIDLAAERGGNTRLTRPDTDVDLDDEIIAGTVLTIDGEVRHPAVRQRLDLDAPAGTTAGATQTAPAASAVPTSSEGATP